MIDVLTPYLRVYVRDPDGRENFVRIHLNCPPTAVERPVPGEGPNLAAGSGPQTMTGSGVIVAGRPPTVPGLITAAVFNKLRRKRR
jgi:hypothetical protein